VVDGSKEKTRLASGGREGKKVDMTIRGPPALVRRVGLRGKRRGYGKRSDESLRATTVLVKQKVKRSVR